MKPFLLGVVATLIALMSAGLAVVYSGAYNVAADRPHYAWRPGFSARQ